MVSNSEKIIFLQFSQDEAIKLSQEIKKLIEKDTNAFTEYPTLIALENTITLELAD